MSKAVSDIVRFDEEFNASTGPFSSLIYRDPSEEELIITNTTNGMQHLKLPVPDTYISSETQPKDELVSRSQTQRAGLSQTGIHRSQPQSQSQLEQQPRSSNTINISRNTQPSSHQTLKAPFEVLNRFGRLPTSGTNSLGPGFQFGKPAEHQPSAQNRASQMAKQVQAGQPQGMQVSQLVIADEDKC